MATLYNPPHPGETLREDVLPAFLWQAHKSARPALNRIKPVKHEEFAA